MTTSRSTTIRDKHRRTIARNKPDCGICGRAIDYTLPHLDPASFVVDHIIPLGRGGEDTLANKQAAHRNCNRTKSDRLDEELAVLAAPRTYVTALTWT
jgi:5-methylcytosine-specific restriction endonuclease McrA